MQRIVLVTDPMCSWCWGLTRDFEEARRSLAQEVTFDLVLGGINVDSTQPIGDYGRRYLKRLWQDVHATTGQPFGFRLPERYVHNSVRSCLAVEAVRQVRLNAGLAAAEAVPFDYLHELQRLFFVEGQDITNHDLLRATAQAFSVPQDAFDARMADPVTLERVRFQFDNANRFGTNALPCMLIEGKDGTLSLLAGGYLDASMMADIIRERLSD